MFQEDKVSFDQTEYGAADSNPGNPMAVDAVNPTHEPFTPKTPSARRWSAKDSQYDQGYNEDVTISQGTVTGQFFSTVKKNITLKLRDPCNLCLEICIPVVFVFGIMLLWVAVPNTEYPGMNLLDTSKPFFTTSVNDSKICLNRTGPLANSRYPICDFSLPQFEDAFCFPQTDNEVCAADISLLDVITFLGYTGNTFENARYVPDVDQMILLMLMTKQWVSEDSIQYFSATSALSKYGKMHLIGESETLQKFRWYMGNHSALWSYVAGNDFATTAATDAYIEAPAQEGTTWGSVEFRELSDTKMDIALHFNRSGQPWTDEVSERFVSGGLGEKYYERFFASGFLTWQRVVNEFYFAETNRVAPVSPATTPMPYVAYTNASFLDGAATLIPILIVFSFLYPVSQQTKRLVEEKEKRIREAMLIMGLGSGSFYLSHWLTYSLVYFITSLLAAALLKLTVFANSDFFIIFFLFYFFCLSCISLCSLMSSVFSKSRLAALLSPLLFFIIAMPFFAVDDASASLKAIFALLCPSAFAIGVDLMAQYEMGTGMSSSDFASSQDDFPMILVFFFLIFDIVWYFLLAMWFDNILPSEWGTQEHPCFCFIRCVAACRKSPTVQGAENDGRDPKGQFEPEPRGKPSVQLQGLRKEFTRGAETFVAVNDLSLNLYEGEISVILGHNGAGKTTAINLMTGMLAPDAGDCLIYGKSVLNDMRGVRQEIGFCPQHNILWDDMTCREHLEYFAKLKGLDGEERENAVMEMIRAVDLESKLNENSSRLSGGMKRKLSVAIAFVGRSRVVFLDEPTAGMDVAARRHTWDLIKRMSPGRTIVLTTHYMDEADLLGNSISIMSKGRLKCKGSSLFLKSRLGVGYTLNCAIEATANVDIITDSIKSSVPEAEILSKVTGEATYRLPMGDVPQFPDMLAVLENNMQSTGLKSFGISVTTMEEVFLKIAHDEEEKSSTSPSGQHDEAIPTPVAENDMEAWHKHPSQPSGFGRQFVTLFAKRFAYAKRDTRTQVFQVWMPILCLCLAMLMSLIEISSDSPALELAPSMYGVDVETPYTSCNTNYSTSIWDAAVTPTEYSFTNATEFSLELQSEYKKHAIDRQTALDCGMSATLSTPIVLHNTSGIHAVGEAYQQYYRTYLKSTYGVEFESTIWSHPLKRSVREDALINSFSTLFVGIFIMIPFTFIPSTFVSFIVKEREFKSKHAQLIAGMSPVVYWVANFCFDIICFLGTNFLAIIVFLVFSRDEYVGGGEEFGGTFLLFLTYAASGITGAYFCSFAFDNHASAQNVVMLVNFISGFLLVLAVWFFNVFEATEDVGEILPFFFRIVPSYCLGEGIINLATRDLESSLGIESAVFDMDVLGWNLVYMSIEIPLFLGAVLLLDHPARQMRSQKLFHKPDQKPEAIENEDVDVLDERNEIESGSRDTDLVLVKNLCKEYPSNGPSGKKTAVKNMSFGVKAGEVFGFLGTNGAGKTTTMSILCGEQLPTHGRGFVGGFDVVDQAAEARRVVGYCPQFDATLDLLNAEEHLNLYAGLRGIEPSAVVEVVESIIIKAGLEPHRKTLAMNMSGGNRRKLSVAISLIGAPQVVILDEPSAGMDPMARRGLWEVIQAVADKCAVVLTTHHLEEVEALANRVGIMVAGGLKCVGSLQDLKHKFGSGFEMSIRVESEARCSGMRDFMKEHFPTAKEEEFRQQKFTFALPSDTKLSETFRFIEEAKLRLGVTDYSISQTSLEQVFLRIGGDDVAAQDV